MNTAPLMSEIHCELYGPVARVTLNCPDTGNTLDGAMAAALCRTVGDIDRSKQVRALLLTGSGGHFCSGLQGRAVNGLGDAITAIRTSRVPVVAAINGAVAAEGLLLALAGDWLLVDEAVQFTELSQAMSAAESIGLPGFPPPAMRDAIAKAPPDSLSAKAAVRWGLVNECLAAGQLLSHAGEVAARLAAGPTRALVAARRLVDEGAGNSFTAQFRRELEVNRVLRESADSREGVRAFLEKRPASFRGE
jgi:2-(1,2-epoxy-1,2-dihydrophenyl)acetyl-CoA isomerase